MLPKPKHLGPEYASQFADPSVVAAYPCRPPYPPAVSEILSTLMASPDGAVLDAGCGTGDLARRLVDIAGRVDAVDAAPLMIEAGRRLPGGDHPRLRWIQGQVEDAPLDPPYALVTAGESLHWMEWAVVMPRFRDVLVPGGLLAIVGRTARSPVPRADLLAIISRYSTNRDFQPYDLIEELTRRDLFRRIGYAQTAPMPFAQSIDDYIESFHSRNGLSRDRMPSAAAAEFDARLRELVARCHGGGLVTLDVVGTVAWGRPAP